MTVSLTADRITVRSADGPIVRGASLSLQPGRALTILGESGSGKSILAQAILGTLPANLHVEGEVEVLGVRTAAADVAARRPLWGRTLALLPQEPWLALDPTMRVGPQVAETYVYVRGLSWAAAAARAREDLAARGLAGVDRAYPHTLSGGMAQRVALAATRAGGAPILIVDEPTKGLDAMLRDDVIVELQAALKAGGTVLTITHDVHVARALGGCIAIMLNGEIVEYGVASDVLIAPRHEYTRALLAADPEAWPHRPGASGNGREVVLRARGLAKAYGSNRLFDGVNLDISAGSRLSITGPSGAGKSTLGNVLLGLRPPDQGTVERGPAVTPVGLQKLYQDPAAAFPPACTVRVALDDLIRLHGLQWEDALALTGRLRLSAALLDRRPSEISSGELQRFAVVRLLLLKPALIFADEPTSRLDPINQKETYDLLIEAAAAAGTALLVVTHHPDIASAVSDSVLRLGAGFDRALRPGGDVGTPPGVER
jgi:ABC-type glutathione transport system ATPase component